MSKLFKRESQSGAASGIGRAVGHLSCGKPGEALLIHRGGCFATDCGILVDSPRSGCAISAGRSASLSRGPSDIWGHVVKLMNLMHSLDSVAGGYGV